MASDRQLSRDFWLHEFSGWEDATASQVARLADLVAMVLQPIRSGVRRKVVPTSWIEWSDGTPRDGAHAHGGAVDFVVDGHGKTFEAFRWAQTNIVPGGQVGRLIYEPARADPRQGEHIHVASRDAMAAVGRTDVQVLVEKAEGEYEFFRAAAPPLALAAVLGMAAAFVAGGARA